jgi:hypothetical protein
LHQTICLFSSRSDEAESLPEPVWHKLQRPRRPQPQTEPRRRSDNVKDRPKDVRRDRHRTPPTMPWGQRPVS